MTVARRAISFRARTMRFRNERFVKSLCHTHSATSDSNRIRSDYLRKTDKIRVRTTCSLINYIKNERRTPIAIIHRVWVIMSPIFHFVKPKNNCARYYCCIDTFLYLKLISQVTNFFYSLRWICIVIEFISWHEREAWKISDSYMLDVTTVKVTRCHMKSLSSLCRNESRGQLGFDII